MPPIPNWPTIGPRNSGYNVCALQCLLNFRNKNAALKTDGIFGPLTRNAVIAYQKGNNLVQDGLAGPATLAKLVAGVIVRNPTANMAARAAQYLLNKFGATLVIDGIFGPKSEAAAKNFQNGMDIAKDGIIGPISWRYLLGYESYGC